MWDLFVLLFNRAPHFYVWASGQFLQSDVQYFSTMSVHHINRRYLFSFKHWARTCHILQVFTRFRMTQNYTKSLNHPTLGEWSHAYGRSRYTTTSKSPLRTLSAWSTSWRSSPRPAPSGPPTCSTWTWPPWSRWPDSCSPTSSSSCSSRWARTRATLPTLWDWSIPQWSNCNYRNQIPIALFIIHILITI